MIGLAGWEAGGQRRRHLCCGGAPPHSLSLSLSLILSLTHAYLPSLSHILSVCLSVCLSLSHTHTSPFSPDKWGSSVRIRMPGACVLHTYVPVISPVTCNPTRAVTLPKIEVPHRVTSPQAPRVGLGPFRQCRSI